MTERECAKWQHLCHPRKYAHCHPRNQLLGDQVTCHPQLDWGSSVFFLFLCYFNFLYFLKSTIKESSIYFFFCFFRSKQESILFSFIFEKKYFLDSRNRSEWQRWGRKWQKYVAGMTRWSMRSDKRKECGVTDRVLYRIMNNRWDACGITKTEIESVRNDSLLWFWKCCFC